MKPNFRNSTYWKVGITAFLVIALSIIFFFMIDRHTGLSKGLGTFMGILEPFIWGLVMAYLLCPLYNFCVRHFRSIPWPKGKNGADYSLTIAKGLATLVSLVVLVGIVVGIIMLIIPQMIQSIVSIVKVLPSSITQFTDWLQTKLGANSDKLRWLYTWLDDTTGGLTNWIQDKLLPGYEAIASGVSEVGMGIVSVVKNFFIGLVVCAFFINRKEIFAAQCKKLVLAVMKEEHADNFMRGAAFVNKTFGGFINGKLLDSLIIGIICFVCMMIFRWPYPVLISVIVGVTNIIPFFGPFIGAIPSALLLLLQSPMTALYFLIFILILQQIDGNIIGPKILGGTTGLASFWVLFAILVGGGLFGVLGMILGVPVFAVIYAYLCYAVNRSLKKKGYSTDLREYKDLYKYGKDMELVNEHSKET